MKGLDELRRRLGPKVVLIVTGAPGSGKSHLIKELKLNAVAFDDYRGEGPAYRYKPADNERVHFKALRDFKGRLRESQDPVAVEGVFSSPESIRRFYDASLRHGRTPVVVTVKADPKVAAERGQHGVKEKAVAHMAKSIEERRLPPEWQHVELTTD